MGEKLDASDTTPRRFTLIAAIFLAVIAASQAARIYYGLDIRIGDLHVPMGVSWALAGVLGIVAVFAFREGSD